MQINRSTPPVTNMTSGLPCQYSGMLMGICSLVTILAYHSNPPYRCKPKHHLTPSHNSTGAIKNYPDIFPICSRLPWPYCSCGSIAQTNDHGGISRLGSFSHPALNGWYCLGGARDVVASFVEMSRRNERANIRRSCHTLSMFARSQIHCII
jgi:hypothetical protein